MSAPSLTQPSYNGGALQAESARLRPPTRKRSSVYRQTVLQAFQRSGRRATRHPARCGDIAGADRGRRSRRSRYQIAIATLSGWRHQPARSPRCAAPAVANRVGSYHSAASRLWTRRRSFKRSAADGGIANPIQMVRRRRSGTSSDELCSVLLLGEASSPAGIGSRLSWWRGAPGYSDLLVAWVKLRFSREVVVESSDG